MRWFYSLLLVGAALGCQQDPYKGKAKVEPAQPPPTTPASQLVANGTMGLEVSDVMIFTEGMLAEFVVKGTVPSNGTPKVFFRGLPAGMKYNPQTQMLSWTPDDQAGNDPNDPLATMHYYTIEVQLFSSESSVVALTKTVVLLVKDKPPETPDVQPEPAPIDPALPETGSL